MTAAQVVVAVLLLRIAENKRKRPPAQAPELVRYGSHFAAMLMGRHLLSELGFSLERLDHRTFEDARKLVEERGDAYFERAAKDLKDALDKLYGRATGECAALGGDLPARRSAHLSATARCTRGRASLSPARARRCAIRSGARASQISFLTTKSPPWFSTAQAVWVDGSTPYVPRP